MATEGRELLESWKEISAYLKRSEKTCRRFEALLGLPVHRLDGTPRSRVFAYKDELDVWLLKKLNHAEEEAGKEEKRRRRKRALVASGAVAIVTLAAGAALVWRPFSSAPAPIQPRNPSLAILPFDNPAKEPGLEPWRTALADLAVTDFVQSRYVNVIGITDLARALAALGLGKAESYPDDSVKAISETARADYVATGSLVREGSEVVLTVQILCPNRTEAAKPIRIKYRGEEDVFSAVDALTRDIKRAVGLTSRHVSWDIDRDAAAISTSSPQAFLLCSRGYRLFGMTKYQEAIPVLKKAVELDPKFALAYKYLYRSCQNALREDERKRYALKAVELSGRLSERERGEVLWLHYDAEGADEAKKKEVLERFFRFYPDDRRASAWMLTFYRGAEDWDRALLVAERAWAANKAEVNICGHLARCYENIGRAGDAVRVLTELLDSNPSNDYRSSVLSLRADVHLRRGEFETALGDIEKLTALFPNMPSLWEKKGIVDLYRHDFEGAERDFRKLLDSGDTSGRIAALSLLRDLCLMRGKVEEAKKHLLAALQITGGLEGQKGGQVPTRTVPIHLEMAYLHRLSGDLPEALKEVEAALRDDGISRAAESGPNVSVLRLKAIIHLDMGAPEEFAKCLEDVRRGVERRNRPRMMRIYHNMLGHRALRSNDLTGAFVHFQKALDLVSVPGSGKGADPEYFYPVAELYARLERGNPVRAIEAFERITRPTVNRLHCGDLYARSLLQLAKLYDRSHLRPGSISAAAVETDRSKAIDNYRKFIALWEDADAMFKAEVDAARSRLAALEKE